MALPSIALPFPRGAVADEKPLSQELQSITDETIYSELQVSDQAMGRWTAEDPSLRSIQRWVRTRR